MATWFGITTPVTEQTLPADTRAGKQLYTVTNESGALIRGGAIVVPEGDAKVEWFNIVNPSRAYSVDGTEQVTLDIKVADDVGAGTYRYRFRVVVEGGVPEEQFNDGPASAITVLPKVVVPAKPFPWWIVAVVGAIVLALIVGGIAVKACGGTPPTPVPTAPPTPVPTPTPDTRPDLTVRVSTRGSLTTETFTIIVRNSGAGNAGAFSVLVQAKGLPDQSFPSSAWPQERRTALPLPCRAIPSERQPHWSTEDPFGTVDETDETNNTFNFNF